MSLATRTLTNYQSWRDARGEVKSGETHWYRTSRLAPVNSALKRSLGTGPSGNALNEHSRDNIEKAIYELTKKSAVETKYKTLLRWLITQLRTKVPRTQTQNATIQGVSAGVVNQLKDMYDFACSDVKSWPGNIKAGEEARVMNRYYLTREDAGVGRAEAQANGFGNAIGKYKQGQLKMVANLILGARSACCTTFAMTAAHLITGGQRSPDRPRVEVVAVPQTHCFVIVHRQGDLTSTGRLPAANTWGPNAVIVDPWLCSLGHNVVYASPHAFPFPAWLTGLEQKYDSHGREQAVFDLKGGLRKIGNKGVRV